MSRVELTADLDDYASVEKRTQVGKLARSKVPRSSHAGWDPPADRADPVAVLEGQIPARVSQLVPLRHFRMAASPFAYYRGTAAMMAADLSSTPISGLATQICGDAHLANFGLFGTPERALAFDLNDFDETHRGPWEWDVKRLAVSGPLLGIERGWSDDLQRELARAAVASYRMNMARFAAMGRLDAWYSRLTDDDLLALAPVGTDSRIARAISKARANDARRAAAKFTGIVNGQRVFLSRRPTLVSLIDLFGEFEAQRIRRLVDEFFFRYIESLPDNIRTLLVGYRLLDVAVKVVGVGSVGTRCLVALAQGRDDDDLLILQVKEAEQSVIAPFVPGVPFDSQGHRVVSGQRLMQEASDIFLGWSHASRDFYIRQFRDMKGGVEPERLRKAGAIQYMNLCGWALARAHARAGDRIAIGAYLGSGSRFDEASVEFSMAYRDQVTADYQLFLDAIASGRLQASDLEDH